MFELIDENPDAVIPLDDVTAVLDSDVALQILLAALESPSPGDRTRTRVVTYRRKAEVRRALPGRDHLHLQQGAARRRRAGSLQEPRPHHELRSVRRRARRDDAGHRGEGPAYRRAGVGPGERLEVARFVMGEMLRVGCRFDLRLFVAKAMPLYLQWKGGRDKFDWRDLVTASVEQHLVEMRHAPTRCARKEWLPDLLALVQAIQREYPTCREQICAVD